MREKIYDKKTRDEFGRKRKLAKNKVNKRHLEYEL